MAVNAGNIDVVSSDISQHPHCSHGPTLLFERYDKSQGGSRQFYACSAFRDRKACSFFQWADQDPVLKSDVTKEETEKSHKFMRKRYHKFRKLCKEDRAVCCTCGLLLLGAEREIHKSQGHSIKTGIGLKLLRKPSLLFAPLENNKTYAQYLFSSKSVEFVRTTLEEMQFSHVLCLGCPRLHERIQCSQKSGESSLESMLLDLDDRYGQIYPAPKFAKYNMFNNHYFEADSHLRVMDFLAAGRERCVLVTDPPFGGMVNALSQALKKLSTHWRSHVTATNKLTESVTGGYMPMVWFFPYFMESRIITEIPGMTMLDYKVDYDNHALYNNHVKQKGSPVRIFTNLPPASFKLPADEGYWYCQQCERYSSKENQHCTECRICPSKDGTSYVHCDMCCRCVKPSRVHCFTCQMCQPKDHQCGKHLGAGCHICGNLDHKRRECPNKELNSKKNSQRFKKRKSNERENVSSKKMKLSKAHV